MGTCVSLSHCRSALIFFLLLPRHINSPFIFRRKSYGIFMSVSTMEVKSYLAPEGKVGPLTHPALGERLWTAVAAHKETKDSAWTVSRGAVVRESQYGFVKTQTVWLICPVTLSKRHSFASCCQVWVASSLGVGLLPPLSAGIPLAWSRVVLCLIPWSLTPMPSESYNLPTSSSIDPWASGEFDKAIPYSTECPKVFPLLYIVWF